MDLSSNIAAMSIANSARKVGDEVAIRTLNKALDIQVQSAAALISSLPKVSSSPVGNLGHHLDVRA